MYYKIFFIKKKDIIKILFLKQKKKKKEKKKWDILFCFHILLSNWTRFVVSTVTTFTYKSEPTLNQFNNSLTPINKKKKNNSLTFTFSWQCTWSYETNVSTCGSMRYYVWYMRYFLPLYNFFKKYNNFKTTIFIMIISSKLIMIEKKW